MRTPRPRARLGWLLAPIAIALLTACQTTPNPTSRIAGTLSVGATTGQLVVPRSVRAAPVEARVATTDSLQSVRPGEVLVRFHDDALAMASTARTLTVDGVRLDVVRDLALPKTRLYRAPGLDAAGTIELARRLEARPDVRDAQPNLIMTAFQTTPNDDEYGQQWHYDAIRMPEAWDVTTGSNAVVVAVVDTGILYRAGDAGSSHPDLQPSRMLQGYDFVTSTFDSGDGTGRDLDPYDDDPAGDAHGTHVAGTIGARTNNTTGVAGVDWAARLLPVRVLGVDGLGSLADVLDGAQWAAGFTVSGVPTNANPAHVINLSLGGAGACGSIAQAAFDRIATETPQNAVVVVAAGNGDENGVGEPVSGTTPASCGNVITVGATDPRGDRATYSNYGTRIDVMAPGGDAASGVLSLGRVAGAFDYIEMQGTSMATPHVAGVVALMKALEPNLTFEEARAFLVLTAVPLTDAECGTGEATDCGAGLIDAAAALVALAGGTTPTPGDGALMFAPDPLDFGNESITLPFTMTNTTGVAVDWNVLGYDMEASNPSFVPLNSVFLVGTEEEVLSGTLAAGASETFVLRIDRAWLDTPGAYQIYLVYDVEGTEQYLTVRFNYSESTFPTGRTSVRAFADPGATVASGGQEAATFFTTFDFPVPAGEYVVVGWTDQNGDGQVNAGDLFGTYPTWVQVATGTRRSGVNIVLDAVFDVEAALRAAVPWAEPATVRAALEATAATSGD